jgi:hypothetical protein
MNNSGPQKAASFFRWAARIIGLLITLMIFYVFSLMNIIDTLFMRIPHPAAGVPAHIPLSAHMVINIVFGMLVLGAFILSWWKERLGGFLFILSSFLVVVLQIVLLIENSHTY